MRRSLASFISSMLFAFLAIAVTRPVAAQDMLPIFGMPDQPAAAVTPTTPPQVSPSAQAVIPPAVVAPPALSKKAQVAAVKPATAAPQHRVATAAEKKKFAALIKKLVPAHRETAHHETVRRVVVHETRPDLPLPGTVVAPPGYYPPGPYYQRLVYAGPYGGWGGFRGPYPYYNYR
jgi:hypothetical protein